MKNKARIKTILFIGIALIAGIVIGSLIEGSSGTNPNAVEHQHAAHADNPEEIWTCSMHPQIRMSEPGDCPICGMTLIPLENIVEDSLLAGGVQMTPTAMKLADVETMAIGKGSTEKNIRLTGKIKANETAQFIQPSHFSGRIEKLTIDFTGQFVRLGQQLGTIYSPELVTAEEELFEAAKIKDTQPALYNAALQKLRNWKLNDSEIQHILKSGKVQENVPITADVSGYVSKKMVSPGDYVQRGQPLYQISDLSKLWVEFDVYESELEWIKKGDEVSFTVSSLPGQEFSGKIDFLDPMINPQTRVSIARLSIKNKDNLLKPEMFVSGVLETKVKSSMEITVPKSAVMWTGKRSLVYVKSETKAGTYFNMREVTLGPELGEKYIITDGLKPGEEIAVNGTFSIDAAAQLAGKPSMMNPSGEVGKNGSMANMPGTNMPQSETLRPTATVQIKLDTEANQAIQNLLEKYMKIKNELTKDNFEDAKDLLPDFESQLSTIENVLPKGKARTIWSEKYKIMLHALSDDAINRNIGEIRKAFRKVSENLVSFLQQTDFSNPDLMVNYCPMANQSKGAIWLSTDSTILNPYFGASMLNCGEVQSTFK